MATISVNGITLHYEEIGSGQPIVFTPGGRWGRDYPRPIAELMSSHYRMIIYDRRNTGQSSVVISDDATEAEFWAEDLAELIRKLGIAPCYVGEYAGCRTTMLMTIRHPELVKGVLLGWPAGGAGASQRLGNGLYGQFIEAAEKGGMAAAVEAPFVEGGFSHNPSSRGPLLAMDADKFIRVMKRWHAAFSESAEMPIAGMPASDKDVASIRAPTMIVAGDDDVHALTTAQLLHRLIPNSEYHDPPIPDEDWKAARGTPNARVLQAESAAPIFLDFLRRLESTGAR